MNAVADDVLAGAGSDGRRRRRRPTGAAGVGVEGRHECRDGLVAVGTVDGRAEFSISSRETMSASRVLIALTILACWRSKLAWSQAPRGPLLHVQSRVAIGLPSRSTKAVQPATVATEVGEVVQHVEGGELEVATDRRRCRGAVLLEGHRAPVGRADDLPRAAVASSRSGSRG